MEATRPAGDRRGAPGSVLRLSCPPSLAEATLRRARQPGPAPPPLAENPRLAWPPVPSTARTFLAGWILGAGWCLPIWNGVGEFN